MIPEIALSALSLVVLAGSADYEPCGGAGCWNQPPLPYQQKFRTGVVGIGLTDGSNTVTLIDLGRVYAAGAFVADSDYPANALTARRFDGIAKQHTVGLSVTRQLVNTKHVSVSGGLLVYRQSLDVAIQWIDNLCCSTNVSQTNVNVTPTLGVALRYEKLSLKVDYAYRVKGGDAPAGGGASRNPGLRLITIQYVMP